MGKDSSSQKMPKDTQKKVVDRVGKSTTPQRIQRKKRDVLQILNKFPQKTETVKVSAVERELSALELCSKVMEELDAGSVLQKKIYKLDNKELLVRLFSN